MCISLGLANPVMPAAVPPASFQVVGDRAAPLASAGSVTPLGGISRSAKAGSVLGSGPTYEEMRAPALSNTSAPAAGGVTATAPVSRLNLAVLVGLAPATSFSGIVR